MPCLRFTGALPLLCLLLSGCPSGGRGTPTDGGLGDAPTPPADAGVDAGPAPDSGVDAGRPANSVPAPPAEVLRTGADGFLLRGVVLTATGVLDPGEVLVVGPAITCVAADCSGERFADSVTVIDTHAVISPGLIDAHNHLPYNFLPEWVPDPVRVFGSRYDWADDPAYEAHVQPYAAHRSTGTHYCPAAKWGELRSLIHGATTMQGQSFRQGCVDRLVRNADHYHGLGDNHLQTSIASPRDITDADAAGYVANFLDPTTPTTRLAVHMSEGVMGNMVDQEFASFAGRDTRMNRHFGTSLLAATDGSYSGTGLLIHTITATDAELMEAADTNAKVVWSPSSNMILYGETADVGRMIELGITVALGPDWTISGEDEMLGEMRFALDWARAEGVAAITPRRLWEMATFDGADAVGLEATIGQLSPGYRADVVVFGRVGADPHAAVLDSRAEDVRLVLIDGQGYYGDLDLEMAAAVNGECDGLDACGAPKFLCVRNTPGAASRQDETLGDIETQLFNILEGIGYPAGEQYGRGDELLELVQCGP